MLLSLCFLRRGTWKAKSSLKRTPPPMAIPTFFETLASSDTVREHFLLSHYRSFVSAGLIWQSRSLRV